MASLVVQVVKNLPASWETQVQSLGWEDPREKEMATHSNVLAWKIPWTEEPSRLQSLGSQRIRHGAHTHTRTINSKIPKKESKSSHELNISPGEASQFSGLAE